MDKKFIAALLCGILVTGIMGCDDTSEDANVNKATQETVQEQPKKVEQPKKEEPKQVVPKTINVYIDAVKHVFEEEGFEFKNCPPVNGVPRANGAVGTTVVDLTGKEKLTCAGITSVMSKAKMSNLQNLNLDLLFLEKICPNFKGEDRNNWLSDVMTSEDGKKSIKIIGDVKITGSVEKSIGALSIIIEHA